MSSWDHPRLRGEKSFKSESVLPVLGSPPLTRGKVIYPFCHVNGKGSPPLTRGKVWRGQKYGATGRITPAYAGKSSSTPSATSAARDHPRLRGEKPIIATENHIVLGSPPLTRGKGHVKRTTQNIERITPAYAGKSDFRSLSFPYPQDHPRLRGEKSLLLPMPLVIVDHPRLRGEKKLVPVEGAVNTGSPPLTRGKVIDVDELLTLVRITPAYAGKRNGSYTGVETR